MTEVARCNGTVLVSDGDTVGLVEVGGGWINTAFFVTLLIALCMLGTGGALFTVDVTAAATVLAFGIVMVAVSTALLRKKRRIAAAGLPAPWLVFDRTQGIVRTPDGARMCALAEVRIERVFQVGSSSKALAIFIPNELVIARGTPFGDSVDAVEQSLRRAIASTQPR